MARIRTIKPAFFTSEDIMALSPLARLLYIGTWLEADRDGRLTWKPNTLKVRYLPGDQCDIDQVSKELLERGLIVLYGDGLAHIPTFLDHQVVNPRELKSKLPDPFTGGVDQGGSWYQKRKTVIERDGGACVRCGSTDNLTVDHILPQSAGGNDEYTNLRTLCDTCNKKRPVAGDGLVADLKRDGYDLKALEVDERHACLHASPRVQARVPTRAGTRDDACKHAPSFPSIPFPSHSLPSEDRIRVQGQGAGTPGSLPRDHMFHAICGPRYRLCLSQTVYAGFARRYGGDEVAARVALTTWVEALEREVGDGAIGDHLWLTKHFDAFLASVGRAPVAPPRPVEVKKPFSVQDALDREAARKAAQS